jgi:hypothetical protein
MGLPVGYTRLEYIQSSGTQYIDTGVIPDANTRAVCDFQLASVDSTNRVIFGVAGQYSFRKYSATVFRTNGTNSVDMSTSISMTDRHIVDKTATLTTVDGTYTATTTAATCSYSLYVFAYNKTGTANQFSMTKIFSLRLYDGDTLVRDYVPCMNPSSVVGLYDRVNGVFYANAGTGDFTAGPELTIEKYVEYIQSSGTQYFDTGYKPNQNTRVVCKFKNTITSGSNYYKIFGTNATSKTDGFNLWCQGVTTWYSDYLGGDELTITTTDGNADIDKNKNVTTINNITVTHATGSFSCDNNLLILEIPTYTSKYYRGTGQLYYFKIYDNETLIHNYYPALDEDGVACLYDEVSKEYLYNSGSGTFTAGFVTGTIGEPIVTLPTFSGKARESLSVSASVENPVTGSTFTATGLPAGLSINSSTGVISGTPTTAGMYTVVVTYTTPDGNTYQSNSVSVSIADWDKPVITCPAITGKAKVALTSVTVTVTNPISGSTFSLVGFPAGLSINDSGVISGTPTENGDFSGIVVYSTPSDGDFKSAKVAVSINQAEIDETILLELITDRTLKDITDVRLLMQSGMTVEGISVLFANSKGSYNMSDMNRVSDATKWLAGYLKQLSIDIKAYLNNLHVSMSEKLDPKIDESIADIAMNSWGRSEKPTAAQLKTYLETITRVVNQMEQTWKLPSTMNKLTYTGANQIEQAILDEHEYSIKRKAEIYDLADRLASVVIYSDMITANEMEGYY